MVQWRRRLTADEQAAAGVGPDAVQAVHACGPHAITVGAATLVHQPTCVAAAAALPACGCIPEAAPEQPSAGDSMVQLPTGWTVAPAAAGGVS